MPLFQRLCSVNVLILLYLPPLCHRPSFLLGILRRHRPASASLSKRGLFTGLSIQHNELQWKIINLLGVFYLPCPHLCARSKSKRDEAEIQPNLWGSCYGVIEKVASTSTHSPHTRDHVSHQFSCLDNLGQTITNLWPTNLGRYSHEQFIHRQLLWTQSSHVLFEHVSAKEVRNSELGTKAEMIATSCSDVKTKLRLNRCRVYDPINDQRFRVTQRRLSGSSLRNKPIRSPRPDQLALTGVSATFPNNGALFCYDEE